MLLNLSKCIVSNYTYGWSIKSIRVDGFRTQLEKNNLFVKLKDLKKKKNSKEVKVNHDRLALNGNKKDDKTKTLSVTCRKSCTSYSQD